MAKAVESPKLSPGKRWLGLAAALLVLAPGAFADVQITLTGPGAGNLLDNIYTSPYAGTVNGVKNVPIICDDFADSVYLQESWTATVSTIANLASNVKWGTGALAEYMDAAWLAEQLANPANTTLKNEYLSYAIWYALDPTDVTSYLTSYPDTSTLSQVQSLEDQADTATKNLSASDFSNVLVYTAVPGTATCTGGPCTTPYPQEFLRVTAPEASTPALLAVDLLGLASLVVFLRRRRLHSGPRS